MREYEGTWMPVAGWVVWDDDEGGPYCGAFRGRIYSRREQAEKVLEGIVDHRRPRMSVREILVQPRAEETKALA